MLLGTNRSAAAYCPMALPKTESAAVRATHRRPRTDSAAPSRKLKSVLQTPTNSKKPIELTADNVEANVLTLGDTQDLKDLKATGAVHVFQEGGMSADRKKQDKGVDIKGDLLTLDHHAAGNILKSWQCQAAGPIATWRATYPGPQGHRSIKKKTLRMSPAPVP